MNYCTKVPIEDQLNSVISNDGAIYSSDGKRLISVSNRLMDFYEVKVGTEIICDDAFHGRYDINEVVFPNSLKAIGARAFKDAHNLKVVSLPNGLVSIGEEAFADCRSLWSVSIPETVEYIGSMAFANCLVGNIVLSKGLTCINEGTFSSCSSLYLLRIPDSVKEIADDAFAGCTGIENIYVSPESVERFKRMLPKKLRGKVKAKRIRRRKEQ